MKFPFYPFVTALSQIAPVLLPFVPGGALIAPFVSTLLDAMRDAEITPGLSGPAKRAYVQELVADGAILANQAKPGSVDVPLVVEAAGHYVDAIIATINQVQKAKAALPQVPAIAAPVVPPGLGRTD